MVGLGDLAGGTFFSLAAGVSPDGTVVVGQSRSTSGHEPFRWAAGVGMVGLGDLPGGLFGGAAQAASVKGSVVVGSSSGPTGKQAFLWTPSGGMVGLGYPVGSQQTRSEAFAVSPNGNLVVGFDETTPGVFAAIIWESAGGMRKLQDVLVTDYGLGTALTGWTLQLATGISADNRTIVGWGTNPNGDTEACMATLPGSGGAVPTMSTWGMITLVAILLLIGLWILRRQQRTAAAV